MLLFSRPYSSSSFASPRGSIVPWALSGAYLRRTVTTTPPTLPHGCEPKRAACSKEAILPLSRTRLSTASSKMRHAAAVRTSTGWAVTGISTSQMRGRGPMVVVFPSRIGRKVKSLIKTSCALTAYGVRPALRNRPALNLAGWAFLLAFLGKYLSNFQSIFAKKLEKFSSYA